MLAQTTFRRLRSELTAPLRRLTSEAFSFSAGERFAVPHSFAPELTLGKAMVAALVAITRVFLGSALFALWGVAAWMTYATIGNHVLGVIALVPFVAMFVLSLALLMLAISSFVTWAQRRKVPSST